MFIAEKLLFQKSQPSKRGTPHMNSLIEPIGCTVLCYLFFWPAFKIAKLRRLRGDIESGKLTPLDDEVRKLEDLRWNHHRLSKLVLYLEGKKEIEREGGIRYVYDFQTNLAEFQEEHHH